VGCSWNCDGVEDLHVTRNKSMPIRLSRIATTFVFLAQLTGSGDCIAGTETSVSAESMSQPPGKGSHSSPGTPQANPQLTDDEAVAEFERLLQIFCTTQDSQTEISSARAMRRLMPGKTGYEQVWRKRAAHATADQVHSLIRLADSKQYEVHTTAVRAISLCGDMAIDAVPMLTRLAQDKDEANHYLAAGALEVLAGFSRAVRARMIEMTLGPDLAERLVAVEALRQWNWPNPEVARHLIKLVKESDDATAMAATRSMTLSPPDLPAFLPILFDQIDNRKDHRPEFIALVPTHHPEINPFVPRLVRLLSDKSPETRAATCAKLAEAVDLSPITPELLTARAELIRLRSDVDEKVRVAARKAVMAFDQANIR
jgi:hypothetical protein